MKNVLCVAKVLNFGGVSVSIRSLPDLGDMYYTWFAFQTEHQLSFYFGCK